MHFYFQSTQYRHSLYAEYAVCVGLKKYKIHLTRHNIPASASVPMTALSSCLRLNGNDQTIPMKRHQQYGAERRKQSPCITFRHIHNKVFWLLTLITCFNVGNYFTTTNTSNILSEFPCSLMKIIHSFNMNKNQKSWFL